jgi:hypothetical protein
MLEFLTTTTSDVVHNEWAKLAATSGIIQQSLPNQTWIAGNSLTAFWTRQRFAISDCHSSQ